MKKLLKKPEFIIGTTMIFVTILVAIFAPFIATHDPMTLTDDLLTPPGREYYFGTDNLGRDVFSMAIYGTRASLYVGITAAIISTLIGITIGAITGYYGGHFDKVVSEIINIFLMIPTFFLIILCVSFYGSGIRNVVIVIALTSWMGTARMMRAQTMSIKERDFINSSICMGESDFNIIFRHILPHGIFPIVVNATLSISSAILYEASLSFLGLGDRTIVSWGQLIYNGRAYLTNAWWITTFAGLFLVFVVVGFSMIANGINKMLVEESNE